MKLVAKAILIFSSFPFLIACEASKSITQPMTDFFDPPLVLACPEHRVVSDAARLEKFKDGDRRALVDVDFISKITNMRLSCESHIDKKTNSGSLDVDIVLDFSSERGPAHQLGESEFFYFIGITNSNYKILYREVFKIKFNFKKNSPKIIMSSKPVTVGLPIRKDLTNTDYIIFSGFKTSREQLHRNRFEKMQRLN